jgi:hypothetical protein
VIDDLDRVLKTLYVLVYVLCWAAIAVILWSVLL